MNKSDNLMNFDVCVWGVFFSLKCLLSFVVDEHSIAALAKCQICSFYIQNISDISYTDKTEF